MMAVSPDCIVHKWHKNYSCLYTKVMTNWVQDILELVGSWGGRMTQEDNKAQYIRTETESKFWHGEDQEAAHNCSRICHGKSALCRIASQKMGMLYEVMLCHWK